MPWLNHPSYLPVRDALIDGLRHGAHRVSSRAPIVFLCGGGGSHRRDTLAAYLRKKTDALVFYAEDVWGTVGRAATADALQMERRLAELADIVVVIVESPGTFAEFGAFSLHEGLLKKLLPILDKQYEHNASFVNTGPVRSVNQESGFRPVIYTKFDDSILLCAAAVERRLALVKNLDYTLDAAKVQSDSRNLLVFVVALVALLFPVTEEHLAFVVARLFSQRHSFRLTELLSLAVSLGLLRKHDIAHAKGRSVFYAPTEHRRLLNTDRFDHSAARARIFAVLQRLPDALAVVEQLEAGSNVVA